MRPAKRINGQTQRNSILRLSKANKQTSERDTSHTFIIYSATRLVCFPSSANAWNIKNKTYETTIKQVYNQCAKLAKLSRCSIPSWTHQGPHQVLSPHSFLSSVIQQAYLQVGLCQRTKNRETTKHDKMVMQWPTILYSNTLAAPSKL